MRRGGIPSRAVSARNAGATRPGSERLSCTTFPRVNKVAAEHQVWLSRLIRGDWPGVAGFNLRGHSV